MCEGTDCRRLRPTLTCWQRVAAASRRAATAPPNTPPKPSPPTPSPLRTAVPGTCSSGTRWTACSMTILGCTTCRTPAARSGRGRGAGRARRGRCTATLRLQRRLGAGKRANTLPAALSAGRRRCRTCRRRPSLTLAAWRGGLAPRLRRAGDGAGDGCFGGHRAPPTTCLSLTICMTAMVGPAMTGPLTPTFGVPPTRRRLPLRRRGM